MSFANRLRVKITLHFEFVYEQVVKKVLGFYYEHNKTVLLGIIVVSVQFKIKNVLRQFFVSKRADSNRKYPFNLSNFKVKLMEQRLHRCQRSADRPYLQTSKSGNSYGVNDAKRPRLLPS